MSIQSKSLDSILSEISRMLDLNKQKNAEARKRGEDYNIFEILGKKHSELAHSAFIANILDPNGSHALGVEPLRSFLNNIGVSKWSEADFNKAEVNVEVAIVGKSEDEWGRMDIVIKSNDKAIIIENKIDAGDQPMQLNRYKTFAKNNFERNHTLLYLTLDGHHASNQSAEGLLLGSDYLTISYEKDILKLIDDCIRLAVQKPLVREVLVQYRNTVESLVGTNGYECEIKALFEYIMQHGEIISQIFTDDKYLSEREMVLNNYHRNDFFHYALKYLVDKLKDYADNNGLICNLDDIFSGGRYSGFSFKREGWSKTIVFQFTMHYWKGCYYGVHSTEEVIPGKKMEHLKAKPNYHFCYGNTYTRYKNWNLEGLISGEIKESIIDAIEKTIEAIDREPDKYPM